MLSTNIKFFDYYQGKAFPNSGRNVFVFKVLLGAIMQIFSGISMNKVVSTIAQMYTGNTFIISYTGQRKF